MNHMGPAILDSFHSTTHTQFWPKHDYRYTMVTVAIIIQRKVICQLKRLCNNSLCMAQKTIHKWVMVFTMDCDWPQVAKQLTDTDTPVTLPYDLFPGQINPWNNSLLYLCMDLSCIWSFNHQTNNAGLFATWKTIISIYKTRANPATNPAIFSNKGCNASENLINHSFQLTERDR